MRGSTVIRILLCTVLLFSVAVITPPGEAEAGGTGWHWLNPLDTGDTLNDVCMSPASGSSCMWTVGNYGFIAKTFDYGASWHRFTPTGMVGHPDLTDVDLVADSIGWAVGANGTIVKISDGWNVSVQTAPAGTGHLYAVDALDENTAYAVGEAGVIIKTLNGGTNWTTVHDPGLAGFGAFNAIQLLNNNQGWVAGSGSGGNTYFMTSGLLYDKSCPGADVTIEDIAVDPAANTLWVVGQDGVSPLYYRVTDDLIDAQSDSPGLPYAATPSTAELGGRLTSIRRVDTTHLWITSSNGQVYFSNGADAWTAQTIPYSNKWLNDVDFRVVSGQYKGVFVGSNGVLGVTTNGGTTWGTRPSSQLNLDVIGIDFISTTTGFVTQGDKVAKTTNSGVNWSMMAAPPAGGALLDVDFRTDGKGWAVGREGTADFYDGTSWTSIASGMSPGRDLYSVSYLDAMNIWACGDNGTIAKSTGTSWTMSADPQVTGGFWRSIDFFDSTHGIAVGCAGQVVYTTDGSDWQSGVSGTLKTIHAVDMVSPQVGFMVGEDEDSGTLVMKKTENGGATWTSMAAPTDVSWKNLRGVAFADENNGWITGEGGTVLHTTTGGTTWVSEPITSESFMAISAVSPSAAWIGGYTGAIISNYYPPAPPSKTTVYRFFNMKNGTHLYTADYAEKLKIITSWPDIYRYEGTGYTYAAYKASQPLYRFFNMKNGSHFYTATEDEKAKVLANWPDIYRYEGPAYNISNTPLAGATTVYRFFRYDTGSHFYTADPAERDKVKTLWPTIYRYEGEAYWLPQ